jgi:hypothetical protein
MSELAVWYAERIRTNIVGGIGLVSQEIETILYHLIKFRVLPGIGCRQEN